VRTRAAQIAPWVGVTAFGIWVGGGFVSFWLLVAAAAFVTALVLGRPGRPAVLVLGAGLMIVSLGFTVEVYAHRVATQWNVIWAEREGRIAGELADELDALLRRGREAAVSLARASLDSVAPQEVLARIRRSAGYDAAIVFDAVGTPVVWDGSHRGRLPDDVGDGEATYRFGGTALARYLYVTERLPTGGSVALARLVDSDLPPEVRRSLRDVAIEAEERADGASIRILDSDRAEEGVGTVFDYGTEEATLFAVRVTGISAEDRLRQVERDARSWGSLLTVLLWIGLAVVASGRTERISAAVAALVLGLELPLENVWLVGSLASPADGLLAGRPLGRWLWVAIAIAIAAAALPRPRAPRRIPRGAGAVFVALAVPLSVGALASALSEGFLASGSAQWSVFALLLTLIAGLIVRGGIELESRNRRRLRIRRATPGPRGPWVVGAALAAALSFASAFAAIERPGLPVWALAATAIPVLFFHRVIDGRFGREALAWALAFGVSSASTLPFAWGERLQARMVVAEAGMERLGVVPDPYLDYLLRDFAAVADSLDAGALRPVELLYQSWRTSELGDAPYPIHLTLWLPNGVAREDLRIGALPTPRPAMAERAFLEADARSGPVVREYGVSDAHYVVSVPLHEGRVLTGVVPPLRELGRTTVLGPLFESLNARPATPLSLVPLEPGEAEDENVAWVRTARGWTGERAVTYPEALYHAHYEVDLPPVGVWSARGALLVALHLAAGLAIVGLGAMLLGRGIPRGAALREALAPLASFRTRITVALFGFFAASNLIFGSLAYRTIEGASRRAAELLATRAADEASEVYFEVGGVIDLLAERVGTEVLQYRDGQLREGSIEPLVELGLYDGWTPYPIQRELAARELVAGSRITRLGPWAYVTAFGRLPDGDVVATPVPMDAGADAVRQAEVRDLLAFAMLLGAILSVVVAIAAGRALARPIGTLRVASERVGSGNLEVRLPEGRADEFGAVFDAFNRMVHRLGEARVSLLRTTRRTRAIVEESATGVLAVDATGVVTLVNERAEGLLGLPVREGVRVAGPEFGEIGEWLQMYLLEGSVEAASELHLDERRIRVRVRRIEADEEAVGAVVSLEDVTDELRAERVLAWGEMARQVAHEVKNPLTPIKLSIQHVQRAWRDGRPDFSEILERNAEAMLGEIDRLADIASSFSRLGAPQEAGTPLEEVDLARVVEEVLTLYRSGGAVSFDADLPERIGLVRARRTEVKEVLVNLFENARNALPEGGTVTVRGERLDDGRIRLSVVDDGAGIDEEFVGRVFEPHFSTRSTGAGLGLAIVRRLVESWGGEVDLDTGVEVGTSVRVTMQGVGDDEGGPPPSPSAT
jgi:signal transduction histidine kinase